MALDFTEGGSAATVHINEGNRLTCIAGAALSCGDVVYISDSNFTNKTTTVAKASNGRLFGSVLADAASGAKVTIAVRGVMAGIAHVTLAAGTCVKASAGELVADTTYYNAVVIVGAATDAVAWYFI